MRRDNFADGECAAIHSNTDSANSWQLAAVRDQGINSNDYDVIPQQTAAAAGHRPLYPYEDPSNSFVFIKQRDKSSSSIETSSRYIYAHPTNMPSFLDDVTTGLKGIRGAGDALRGELMEAVDHAFDSNSSHATTAADVTKNQTTAEKGKADMKAADEMVARHEQAHRDKKAGVAAGAGIAGATTAAAGTAGEAFSGTGAQTGAAPVATHESTSDAYGSGAGPGQVPIGQTQTQTGAPGTGTTPGYGTGHPVA